jgi:hypothetical protein
VEICFADNIRGGVDFFNIRLDLVAADDAANYFAGVLLTVHIVYEFSIVGYLWKGMTISKEQRLQSLD